MAPLPDEGWVRLYDEIQQRVYWYNAATQESQWEEAAPEEAMGESGTSLTAAEASQAKAFFEADVPDAANDEAWREDPPAKDWAAVQQQWQALGMTTPAGTGGATGSARVSGRPGAEAADELTSEEEGVDEGDRGGGGDAHAWARQPAPRLPAPRKDALGHLRALDRAAVADRRSSSERSRRGDVASRQPRGATAAEEGDDAEADPVQMLPPRRSRLRYLSVMADTERDLNW